VGFVGGRLELDANTGILRYMSSQPSPASLDELLEFAKMLARDAGQIITAYFDLANKQVETKADESPVTIADKKINQLVIDRVQAAYPTHGILAEEGSADADRQQLWVCDPIDGTKSYIQGIPTAMFSLAYVEDGVPLVSVLYDAFQDKLYTASKGGGAFCNDVEIHVSALAELKGASIAGMGSYNQIVERRAFFDSLAARGAQTVIVPGNVFRNGIVATGSIEAHVFPGCSAHDIAASALIIEEAGGKVTNLRGEPQAYNQRIYGAIVSNGLLHDELVQLLKDFGPEKYVGY
jgi:fructose-1,6-bisphosphatase/inositol monophosphatase family enzyme